MLLNRAILSQVPPAKKIEAEYSAETNSFKDLRDGKVYKTVTIGSQIWMAENLSYEMENSYCFNDAEDHCEKTGRLYTWEAAMDGACPSGWHLSSYEDWKVLIPDDDVARVIANRMKSTSGWLADAYGNDCNGTDEFGLNIIPSGWREPDGTYDYEKTRAFFWTTKEYNSNPTVNAWRIAFLNSSDNVSIFRSEKPLAFRSVA